MHAWVGLKLGQITPPPLKKGQIISYFLMSVVSIYLSNGSVKYRIWPMWHQFDTKLTHLWQPLGLDSSFPRKLPNATWLDGARRPVLLLLLCTPQGKRRRSLRQSDLIWPQIRQSRDIFFSDQMRYILAYRAKMYWIWSEKLSQICPI